MTTATEERQQEQLSFLEVLATMTGVQIKTRGLASDWLLLTYDLPTSEEGNQARRDFLTRAPALGAVQHTESVYILPWSQATASAVLSLAEAGDVFVWYAKPGTEAQAESLSRQYDEGLRAHVEVLEERTSRILEHAKAGKLKLAENMLDRTWPTVDGLARSAGVRGDEDLAKALVYVHRGLRVAQAIVDGDPDRLEVIRAEAGFC